MRIREIESAEAINRFETPAYKGTDLEQFCNDCDEYVRSRDIFDREYSCNFEDYDKDLFEIRTVNDVRYLWYKGDLDEITLPQGCENIYRMFCGSAKIPKIVHGIEKVKYAVAAFAYNDADKIDISDWDVRSVENACVMFNLCKAKSIKLPNKWNSLIAAQRMFENCSNLKSIDINFGECDLQYLDAAFAGCSKLTSIVLKGESRFLPWMSGIVKMCSKLTTFDMHKYVAIRRIGKETAYDFGVCNDDVVFLISDFQESLFRCCPFNYEVSMPKKVVHSVQYDDSEVESNKSVVLEVAKSLGAF